MCPEWPAFSCRADVVSRWTLGDSLIRLLSRQPRRIMTQHPIESSSGAPGISSDARRSGPAAWKASSAACVTTCSTRRCSSSSTRLARRSRLGVPTTTSGAPTRRWAAARPRSMLSRGTMAHRQPGSRSMPPPERHDHPGRASNAPCWCYPWLSMPWTAQKPGACSRYR